MTRFSDDQARALADLFIGRQSDYALQMLNGRYRRVGFPVSLELVQAHLAGECTIGTYVIDEQGLCFFAVFDADQPDGLPTLAGLRRRLLEAGTPSYLEESRRGGHLWVFFDTPLPARLARRWLLPFCPAGVEFYPKQDETDGVGSLIRVPLGVHLRSGRRYPFVVAQGGQLVPVASTLEAMIEALSAVKRAVVPQALWLAYRSAAPERKTHTSQTPIPSPVRYSSRGQTIAEWCAEQEPFSFIGRYVRLDSRGMGHCPFPAHHKAGRDRHPSFQVFQPKRRGGNCWRCYAGDVSGNVFNFLQMYHELSAQELWTRLRRGEVL